MMDNTIENIQHNRLFEDFVIESKPMYDSTIAVIEIIEAEKSEIEAHLRLYSEVESDGKWVLAEEFIKIFSKYDSGLTLKALPERRFIRNEWELGTRGALFRRIVFDKRNIFYRASLLKKNADLKAIKEKFVKTFSSIEGMLNILLDQSYFDEV